ncbi:MAG TPA: hypothetical protein VJ385_14270 [Fibrobacteria bacterium]|nr:hypothetical protein [Fibrobacteria bacterium]
MGPLTPSIEAIAKALAERTINRL